MKSERRPRIAFVTFHYSPDKNGLANSAVRISQHLAESGFKVHVILCLNESRGFMQKSQRRLSHGLRIHVIPWKNLDEDRSRLVAHIVSLNRKFHFDLIHGFSVIPAGPIAAEAGEILNIPVLVSIRGNDVGACAFDSSFHPYLRRTFDRSRFVTSVSRDLLELAGTFSPLEKKSRIIWNGVSTPPVPVAYRANPEKLILGTAGVFQPKKNVPVLLDLLEMLRTKRDCHLILAGDFISAAERKEFFEAAERKRLRRHVTLTGFYDHASAHDIHKNFDIFVIPSMFSEGCPSALLEAMASGLPVVGYPSGAIGEIIVDKICGRLIKSGSLEELAGAVMDLADNLDLRKKLGQQARKVAGKLNLNWERQVWSRLYRQLLEGRSPRSSNRPRLSKYANP